MSISSSSKRLVWTACQKPSQCLSSFVPLAQQRSISWFGRGRDIPVQVSDPLTEEYLKRKPKAPKGFVRGDLAPSSIFEDEEIVGPKPAAAKGDPVTTVSRDPAVMAAVLDPDPRARRRWERKMVIRTIQKRGRLSRAQLIKRQEREHSSKSHNIKTSLKKLGPLARQIAGKTVEDAIIQMRFSKKKAALEVRKHLEHARNEAIVSRGMGLGGVEDREIDGVVIRTKDGKRIKVDDPTTIYVAQAWVGKGDYKIEPDYRARGRTNYMRKPTTHIAVVLKEEATRIRQHKEREEKIKNRKVRIQLPNRPVTAQRQYYSW